MVFWKVLRKVRAWAETSPEGRAGLFDLNKQDARERLALAGVQAPDLVEALGTFALLVRAPGVIGAKQLAEACHQVHEWAEERSLLKVAMLFAEAAALADPEDPARANDAGRMCRRAARDERAATWYHRGFGLGVRTKSHQETIRAQIGYGNLMKDLGQHEEARRYFEKAAQRAINTGRLRQAGEAHHDLLAIAAEVGSYSQALRHVRRALELYPTRHPRIPYLMHDFAFVLIRRHYFSAALTVLRQLLPVIRRPEEQLLLYGTIARAAGGARQRDCHDEAERKAQELIGLYQEYAPAAWIHLAEGARAFGEWHRAEEYVRMAADIAREQKNTLIERDALQLAQKIAERELAPHEEELPNQERTESLIARFAARLRKWLAPKQQPGASRKGSN
ncbi:MAG TPA: tetratricopeptide repeat protein [Longimicrobiaceae bacterium]|nr:tetratricopeptide repeat protein [Longimicrobiaceae bacterium]